VYALVLLTLLPLAGFTVEGLRIVAVAPEWAQWSPAGNAVASLLRGLGMTPELAARVHSGFFWFHLLLGLLFVASIPFTKLRHLVLGPLNIVRRERRQESALSFIEDIETAEVLGVGRIDEFRPQQLLSFEACVRCGRCERNCPAAQSGMDFSPRRFVQALRETAEAALLNGNGNGAMAEIGPEVSEAMAWACTTCGACLSGCPLFVNPVEEVIDLRRYQVLTTGRMPAEVGATLRNLEQQGNPWGMPAMGRLDWARGLDVRILEPGQETDVLLFVGCAGAFDDRNQQVTRALVRLLQATEVDFAILGADEGCCGETARRLGHEYIFQVFAEQNIEILSQVRFNRIITQCPHCFNTLRNEYPQLGGEWVVQHYSEFLNERIPVATGNGDNGLGRVTYHDPCYLGRYAGEYEAPRQLLERAGERPVEMAKYGPDSFCCGGGGGQMWLETEAEERINLRRLEQALEIEATTIATACPYCLLMVDDAIRSRGLGDSVAVYDIAEVLTLQLDKERES
jgi:Fe-S oxidoreductase